MPLCNLDNDRSRRLCLGVVFCVFIFFLFATFASLANISGSASNVSDGSQLKIAGSFFMCLAIIPILIIEGDTSARCMCHPKHFADNEESSGPVGMFCSVWLYVFAGVAALGGLLYWIGGFVDTGNAQGAPALGLIFFTFPTYVFFHACVLVADFLRESLSDRRRRLLILSCGLFGFALLGFCATVGASLVNARGVRVGTAGTFFLWFFLLAVIISQVFPIFSVEEHEKVFDIVCGGMIAVGGLLVFCGFCTIANLFTRAASASRNNTAKSAATSLAFYCVTWGLFIVIQSCIIAFDMLTPHGLFPVAQSEKSENMSAAQEYGDHQDGQYGNAEPEVPPSYNQSQADYGKADEGDVNIADGDVVTAPNNSGIDGQSEMADIDRPPPPPRTSGANRPPPPVPR